jgi:hypothetical protein
MNRFQKVVKAERVIIEYTKLLAPLLNLTIRQLEVLAYVIELALKCDNYDVLSPENRKLIYTNCYINKHNFSKYVKIYRGHNIMSTIDKVTYSMNKSLLPEIVDNKITISYIININEVR